MWLASEASRNRSRGNYPSDNLKGEKYERNLPLEQYQSLHYPEERNHKYEHIHKTFAVGGRAGACILRHAAAIQRSRREQRRSFTIKWRSERRRRRAVPDQWR